MKGDGVETPTDELERWVERKTAEGDVDRSELVERALRAYRLVDENGGEDDAVGAFETRADELDGRVDALESDLDEKVTDLRERVVQVKRESDRKAARDHAHPELAGDAENALAAVDDVRETVSTLERRIAAGFENYEDVLEYLTDAAEETDEKLDAVANAVVDLRARTAEVERAAAERAAAAELKREANREGVSAAACASCGETVDIALLDAPHCPHCEETFGGVRGKRGLFGSATLTAGERPALDEPADSEGPTDADRPADANGPDPAFESGDARGAE